MELKEHKVFCDWCGAKIGEPCVNNISGRTTEVYESQVHIDRKRKYDDLNRGGNL